MKVTFDTKDITKLAVAMTRYAKIMPAAKANSVLRKAVKPMYQRARMEVPVSNGGKEKTSLSKARNAIRQKSNPNAHRQGGATRRDMRIKVVPAAPGEMGRVLIGVSKKSSKVGWRTHFITMGTKSRKTKRGANRGSIKANNFLERAFTTTIEGVRTEVQKRYQEEFVSWARSNFPQIGV